MIGQEDISRRRLILSLIGAGIAIATPTRTFARRGHPRSNHQKVIDLVIREANNIGISPSLALAVAHAESSFNAYAKSHAGARGIMQIMPATARGEYGIAPELLWNPRINVRLGLHFLARLLKRYQGRADLALSYYNGGSAVGDLPYAKVIPATRKYVRKVQRLRRAYRKKLAWEGYKSGPHFAGEPGAQRRPKRRIASILSGYSGDDRR